MRKCYMILYILALRENLLDKEHCPKPSTNPVTQRDAAETLYISAQYQISAILPETKFSKQKSDFSKKEIFGYVSATAAGT